MNIQFIIVRDLPLAWMCIRAGKKYGIPVLFDMAEDYPAMWADSIRGNRYKLHNLILKNPGIGRLIEKACLKRADRIAVVVGESRERLLRAGIMDGKIYLVSNTPELEHFQPNRNLSEAVMGNVNVNRPTIFYHGYVNRARGVDVVIRGLKLVIEQLPNVRFVVAGEGVYVQELINLTHSLNMAAHVEFLGWVDFKSIPELIHKSDICVIPHMKTKHKDTTIPNKIFDYMACGKPVIASDAKPLKRIIEETNCGSTFISGDAISFAEATTQLWENEESRLRMGANGRLAIENTYNWKEDARRLRAAIEDPL